MEEGARAEIAPHPPTLVDDGEINDWSKEDDEPMEEVRPPAAATDDKLAPSPAEGSFDTVNPNPIRFR